MKLARHKRNALNFCIHLMAISFIVVGPAVADKSDFAKAADLVKEKKYTAAFDIFERLAQAHDPDALYNTAVFLRKGIGHPSNYLDALKWAWLAELGGNARASELREELVNLIPEDKLDSVRDRIKAVLQGRMDAGETIAILQMANYYISVIAEPDYQNAYAFRSLAAALNLKNASNLRDEIESELEAADLMVAQTLAAKLFTSTTWITEAVD